ncbi:MAG: TPM domain-containing protein [Planctomycetota bacterium]|jgi:putative membrane protein
MQRAGDMFDAGQRERISRAVAVAERGTAGEIVPVVATASGRYDRAEDLCGLTVALLALIAVWLGFQEVRTEERGWAPSLVPAVGLVTVLLVVAIGFVLGAALAGRLPLLRRAFLREREMREEVERAAAAAFQQFRVRRTAAATGIVLYVSLYERMVRVVGDDAIAAKLGRADWEGVRDRVLAGLREGQAAEGLVAGIEAAGELLRRHFPVAADDEDELHNELRILD